jgi:hypothetical protein
MLNRGLSWIVVCVPLAAGLLAACAHQQKNGAASDEPASAAPAADPASAPNRKARILHVSGVIVRLDRAAGDLIIRDRAGRFRKFKLAGSASPKIKVGDRVTVWHAGETVSRVKPGMFRKPIAKAG